MLMVWCYAGTLDFLTLLIVRATNLITFNYYIHWLDFLESFESLKRHFIQTENDGVFFYSNKKNSCVLSLVEN